MSSIEEVKENTSNINEKEEKQICIAIEKYLSLMMIEFKEHISKYKLFYENICQNTSNYFLVFEQMISDYSEEINQNTNNLYEVLSKLNIISDELPKVEELYSKIKEMRVGLEKTFKLIKSVKKI